MLLWEVLVRVKPEYDRAKAEGRVFEWLSVCLPRCFAKGMVEPPNWQEIQQTFDVNYDVLNRLVLARSQSGAGRPERQKRRVRLITPFDEPVVTQALVNLRLKVTIDVNNDSELIFQFSGDYRDHGTFNSLEEFWQVAFLSLYRPEWLPWRGTLCADCGRPMPPTKKKRKASGTKCCSGCRVRRSRANPKKHSKQSPITGV